MFAAAVADYSRVVALDPTNAHAYHNRGISYDKQGLYEAAIADFSRVLELDATNANALFNRGSTHDSMGRYEEAIVSAKGGCGRWCRRLCSSHVHALIVFTAVFRACGRAVRCDAAVRSHAPAPASHLGASASHAGASLPRCLRVCASIPLHLPLCSATTRPPWSSIGASPVGLPRRQRAGPPPRPPRQGAVCPPQRQRRRAGCRRAS